MNISGYISKIKSRMRDGQERREQNMTSRIESLKEQRMKAEKKQKLYDEYAKEKAQYNEARSGLRQRKLESNPLYSTGQKVMKQIEQNKKNKNKKPGANNFLSGFSNDSSNAWFPKEKPKQVMKRKKKNNQKVVIYLK